MTGKRAGRVIATVASIAALASGCTKTQLQGDSSSYLIVNSLQGASVQSSSNSPKFSGVLQSDVCTVVDKTNPFCTYFDDLGQVDLSLALKDPGTGTSPTTPTTTNFITINRYHVDYIRADGRNTQGVDVPFSFDGAATFTVGTANTTAVITLVRVQAKQEAPLTGLALLDAQGHARQPSSSPISTIAQVTFYGTDQAGRSVSVMAQITITFADWADPPSGS
jgi:hypothetical protein